MSDFDLNTVVAARVLPRRPRLADPRPPQPPVPPTPTRDAQPYRLTAWRHDGGMLNQVYVNLDIAQQTARALCHLIYWKYAISCGRDVVETAPIETPQDWDAFMSRVAAHR